MKKKFGILLGFAIPILLTGMFAPVRAQEASCHNITAPKKFTGVRGYGTPFNPYGEKQLLMQVECSGDAPVMHVGDGARSTFIYHQAYVYKNDSWQTITLQGDRKRQDWFVGNASVALPYSGEELKNENYVLAYTCQYVNEKWRCGCQDSACEESFWQVQSFRWNGRLPESKSNTEIKKPATGTEKPKAEDLPPKEGKIPNTEQEPEKSDPVGTGDDEVQTNSSDPPEPAAQPAIAPDWEQEVFGLVNQYRFQNGLSPLEHSNILQKEAQAHSMNMATGRIPVGHTGLADRAERIFEKIDYILFAENAAGGSFETPMSLVSAWIRSTEHRKNIEDEFDQTALGIIRTPEGKIYATQLFILKMDFNEDEWGEEEEMSEEAMSEEDYVFDENVEDIDDLEYLYSLLGSDDEDSDEEMMSDEGGWFDGDSEDDELEYLRSLLESEEM